MTVKSIPEGCNSINAYLFVKDGQAAIDFYQKAFGETVACILPGPGGQGIMHAELRIGNSTLMLSEENPQWGTKSPETLGGSPASLHLYMPDVDVAFKKAIDAGCTSVSEPADMFWGDRSGKVACPFGVQWGMATHIEDVSEEEMGKRAQEWFASMAKDQS